jgi:hypothetical protein
VFQSPLAKAAVGGLALRTRGMMRTMMIIRRKNEGEKKNKIQLRIRIGEIRMKKRS